MRSRYLEKNIVKKYLYNNKKLEILRKTKGKNNKNIRKQKHME